MADDQDKSEPKVVNLADARKRQRTVRSGASSQKNGRASGKSSQPVAPKGRTIWTYVQFLLLLGTVAYMMQLCRSGS